MSDKSTQPNPANPYVCAGCRQPIPEGEPHAVVGLATYCPHCAEEVRDGDD